MALTHVEDPNGSKPQTSSDKDEQDSPDAKAWPDWSMESLFSPRVSEASTMEYTDETAADRELHLAAEAAADQPVTPSKPKAATENDGESAKKPPKKKTMKPKGKSAAGRWSEWWTHKAEYFELKTEKGKNKRIMIRGYYPSTQKWRQLAEV